MATVPSLYQATPFMRGQALWAFGMLVPRIPLLEVLPLVSAPQLVPMMCHTNSLGRLRRELGPQITAWNPQA